jgi:hypothetical protein
MNVKRYAGVALTGVLLAAALLATVLPVTAARADDELEKRATWSPPTAEQVKAQLDQWLAEQKVDELTKFKIEALWPQDGAPAAPDQLLDQVAATVALVDADVRELVVHCRHERSSPVPPKFAVLADEKQAPVVRNNLRLLYGRWLAQHDLYDEALAQLEGLEPADVVDPATLLFYKSVGYHRLINKDKCLPALEKLLENEQALPARYGTLARLMAADLQPLKTDSLDEVARIMRNIENRLGLGRAGTIVRKEEEDVVAKLEKLIEELEKQQGGGGGGGGGQPGGQGGQGGQGGSQGGQPMDDSGIASNKGPGNVDLKDHPDRGNWGDLPPKEREEALQNITKDLPAHYREVIEEYFRKIARDNR